jgi:hypothetical protein
MTTDRPRFALVLQDQGGEAPVAARLKALLKRALRSFNFKCLGAAEVLAGGGGVTGQRQPEPTPKEKIR